MEKADRTPKSATKSKEKPAGLKRASLSSDKTKVQAAMEPAASAAASAPTASATPATPASTATATEPARKCFVAGCKNDARSSSIYCSDACIVQHARESLLLMSKEKAKQEKPPTGPEHSAPTTPTGGGGAGKAEPAKLKESVEFGKLMSQATPQTSKSKAINQLRKSVSSDGIPLTPKPANLPDDTPVPVMERKSGKILTGSAAPRVATLEQWLRDNPTYEVVKPSLTSPKTPLKASPVVKSDPASHAASSPSHGATPSSLGSSASKTPSRTPSSSASSSDKQARKKSIDTSKSDHGDGQRVPDAESMRSGAKSSLKDALWNRCKESTGVEVGEKDVEHVTEEIEEALFRLFNKDVGAKYKARYRSLLFNIKDVKNQGLFRKIVERQITPG